ncbi:hypothetical protein O181_026212 [Austropuccinia psidii MF-1]|uniref:Uncharacterized protein n=1 Tax=Austropuccinia psidii MF-1 TaxID=1389203 RepID=A0A9Q3CQ43_9BASI|nr:hypothetical protein [Austropuccinia psidii MF-1]
MPSSIDLSTPLQGHHPMVNSLLDWRKVIMRPMKDGNGKRTFKLGLIVIMSCHPWDSHVKNKTHEIPGNKKVLFLVCLTGKLNSNQLQPQVAPDGWRTCAVPSQHNEPPIQSSESRVPSHEDTSACEHEPEVAPMQSTEEPYVKSPLYFFYSYKISLTPPLTISSLSHYSPLCHYHLRYACRLPHPPPSSPPVPPPSTPTQRSQAPPPQRHKASLIPTMRLGRNLPNCDQP